ncbi:MAG: Uma2 family endonuclease [Pseudanabaena sp.]|jgi:Uma2 family endonuclease|nr:Uma2 family endonuclease [Pseudanabaena sp. M090S1SP2A07QC]MCA6508386.1 Uma2 family endonuclease [Pseudanabaena sp. M172S2SP2A07QC]MCA6510174.1 Uma2 family endonuclease [Pseudanabaena sp. M109S1SP2A07QC]MCA6518806.1 Uma2 family endonuclease [Pseudanabaena sp. M110S1SP2A07QC]MCA6522388.1 Uma2 family endonuclease [Pseudanabaena sp. M051S1SP2A07QC]MCA6526798.1 Uma2 family endonuclease [Pseudanabaena sp. M179S2SP2A07QC]MCA6532590.1 Uma2 family endonuclease [Pseudanabaena sp. M125S2SP2A07QC]MC
MTLATHHIPIVTLDRFLRQPETKPASEFIHGYIYQKPMPQGQHSRLQLKLCNRVNAVTEDAQIALALPELRCTFGDRSIVPDVAVFRWDRLPINGEGEIENVFSICPDWVIEILSPDQAPMRVLSNILHCLKHGTEMGWLLFPKERSLLIFQRDRQPIEININSNGDEILPMPDFLENHLKLTANQIFNWLKIV